VIRLQRHRVTNLENRHNGCAWPECWTSRCARPVEMHDHDKGRARFSGSTSNRCCNARTPPAEAPMPTTNGFGRPRLSFLVPLPSLASPIRALIFFFVGCLSIPGGIWPIYQEFRQGNIGPTFPERMIRPRVPLLGLGAFQWLIAMFSPLGRRPEGSRRCAFLAGEFSRDFPRLDFSDDPSVQANSVRRSMPSLLRRVRSRPNSPGWR